jgi:hypothetical protein
MTSIVKPGESNGKLPLRTCLECSVPEPYRSPDWALIPVKPAQRLNTTTTTTTNNNNNNNKYQETMKLRNYKKLPYWALHTYSGKC